MVTSASLDGILLDEAGKLLAFHGLEKWVAELRTDGYGSGNGWTTLTMRVDYRGNGPVPTSGMVSIEQASQLCQFAKSYLDFLDQAEEDIEPFDIKLNFGMGTTGGQHIFTVPTDTTNVQRILGGALITVLQQSGMKIELMKVRRGAELMGIGEEHSAWALYGGTPSTAASLRDLIDRHIDPEPEVLFKDLQLSPELEAAIFAEEARAKEYAELERVWGTF